MKGTSCDHNRNSVICGNTSFIRNFHHKRSAITLAFTCACADAVSHKLYKILREGRTLPSTIRLTHRIMLYPIPLLSSHEFSISFFTCNLFINILAKLPFQILKGAKLPQPHNPYFTMRLLKISSFSWFHHACKASQNHP